MTMNFLSLKEKFDKVKTAAMECLNIENFKESLKSKSSDLVNYIKTHKKNFAIGASVLIIFAGGLSYYESTQGYKVIFNGKEVGVVKNAEDFTKGLGMVQRELSSLYDTNIVFDEDVKYEKTTISKENVLTDATQCANAIYTTKIDLSAQSAVLVIDGQEVVKVASKEEAKEVMAAVVDKYVNLGANEKIVDKPVVKQDYQIIEKVVNLGEVKEFDAAVNYIMQGTDELQEYTVQNGDTSWDIAVNRGIRINELEQANQDKDITNLHSGDVIKLAVPKSYVDVDVTKEAIYNGSIDFGTTYTEDASIYVGKTKLVAAGVAGIKEVTALIKYSNGVEVSREVQKEVVVKEAINQVVAKGTKKLPAVYGTGRFIVPTTGRVSAINKAGSHAGSRAVDIANSIGTAIYAADAGKVVTVSYDSGYGKFIIINHGNGFSTRYAHLSSTGVSVGQTVSQGQRIAGMGSTGSSTGSHLHFEVMLNGTKQVITNYFTSLRVGISVSP
ncbi:MAG: peptidoglycan DD-metalloendopeptidase family protein [Eubacteriaceae bacterium]|nr:peptidoglycan DD-metalloendopeptidase family protein [Eubacteriaceae bacterium]